MGSKTWNLTPGLVYKKLTIAEESSEIIKKRSLNAFEGSVLQTPNTHV